MANNDLPHDHRNAQISGLDPWEEDGAADGPDQDGAMATAQYTQFVPNLIPTEEELDEKYPNRPKNTKPTLPFHALYEELFEPLLSNKKKVGVGGRGFKQLKPHEIRMQIIERFIGKWRREVGPDIYPAFRLIMPDKDRDRTVYGLKEKIIGKMFVKAMKINKDSEDAQALINWKMPGGVKSAGDFAGRCYEIIKKRPMRTAPGDLTIEQINNMLDKLSMARKEDQQLPIVNEFYYKMNAEELMWIVRIILKQMKVGATEKTFFQAWHPDAESLFNVSSQLKRVCWELYDPNIRLNTEESSVTLMSCFQPQLAQFQKKSLDDVVKSMRPEPNDPEFWIEEKLDGERMQLHMQDGQFKFWSRKAKDYTYLYGTSFEDGALTWHLKNSFNPGVRNIILDGEMITWDPVLDVVVAFGTLKTAAISQNKNHYDETCHRPLFRVFDILYLNDQSLTSYTLRDRRRALSASITPVPRRLEIHPYTPATTSNEIESQLRTVIASASEGLVIKNPRSMYRLNDRNDDWIKVKPEYMTEFGEELDCLIIGGYYGSGRRGGFLSSFLCGLRVDGNYAKPGDPDMRFWSFCKVGGGLCSSDYTKIQHITDGYWQKWDPKRPPSDVIELAGGPLQYERPDEWIMPDKSLVISVKAASIGESDSFRIGKTLRFPRFKSFKEEKDWRSALTTTEFLELKSKVEEGHTKGMDVEKRQRRTGVKRKREVIVIGTNLTLNNDQKPNTGSTTGLFEGYKFFIITDSITAPNKLSKPEIEGLVKSYGGSFYQSEAVSDDIKLIGDRNTVKVTALKKKGEKDIIRPSWLFDCIKQHELAREKGEVGNFVLPLEPKHLLFATQSTAKEAKKNIDSYNDPYCRDLSIEELTQIMEDSMPNSDFDFSDPSTARTKLLSFLPQPEEDELVSQLPGWLFSPFVVYVDLPHLAAENNLLGIQLEEGKDDKEEVPVDIQLIMPLLTFLGSKISRDFDNREITHVVVSASMAEGDEKTRKRVEEMRRRLGFRSGRVPRIVSSKWVEECVKEGTVLDEERFSV